MDYIVTGLGADYDDVQQVHNMISDQPGVSVCVIRAFRLTAHLSPGVTQDLTGFVSHQL